MSQRLLIGSLTVVMLLTTGTTVALGLRQKRVAALNSELALRCDTLRRESDQQTQVMSSLAAKAAADQAELAKLRESSAAAVAALREQVQGMEKQAAAVHDQIRQAQTEGTLKEGRIAELTAQLEETRAGADKAQGQLKAMGYTKDELSDQVGKLRTRLSASQDELDAARRSIQEQAQTIATLDTELSTTAATLAETKDVNVTLARSNLELRDELARRPRVSPFAEGDTYRPARDRKSKAGR